jgi:hypothetical protein
LFVFYDVTPSTSIDMSRSFVGIYL